MYDSFACLLCTYTTHMPGIHRGQKKDQISWNWNNRWFGLPCGHREPNLGPMQKRQVLLTTQSSIQAPYFPPNQYYRMQRPKDNCGYDLIHKHVWNKLMEERRWQATWKEQHRGGDGRGRDGNESVSVLETGSCPQKPESTGQNPTSTSRQEPPTHRTDLDF